MAKTSHPFRRAFGRLLLKVLGWRAAEGAPTVPKYILIAAPHTSNWDLPIMLGVSYVLDVDISWMGKHTIFEGVFGGFMRWLGGIPVDRRSRHDVVKQMADEFARRDKLVLAVPPEGTRKLTEYWKSGFYYIAKAAGVPIALGYLDYGTKVGGVGELVYPTDDLEADLAKIRAFYADKIGKYPSQFKNIEFKPVDSSKARDQSAS